MREHTIQEAREQRIDMESGSNFKVIENSFPLATVCWVTS